MRSIRAKMLIWFGLTLGVLMTAFGFITYSSIKGSVIPLTRDLSQEILKARSAEIGRLIQGYQSEVKTIAHREHMRSGDFEAIRRDLVKREHTLNPDFEILFFTDARGRYITTKGAVGNVSDRFYWKEIMEQGKEYAISDPLISKSTGESIFVVANVVTNEKGERIGIAAATVLLKTLSRIAESIHIGESGVGWVVDGTGLVVAHPNPDLPMKLNLFQGTAAGYRGLEEIGRMIAEGEPGQGQFIRPDGTRLVTIFNPIPNTPGWTFGILMPQSELMERPEKLMSRIIWLMAGMLVIVLIVVAVLSRTFTAPILQLKEGVNVVSTGNLDTVLDIRTGDEIQALAEAFNRMTGDLKEYISNLQRVTREKERVENDLRVANKIQAGMLPRVFPPFHEMEHLDLYAVMEPAREVGGDFFDFFILEDKRLCFCIGDVSGKGVPAALFMVITMTILRNQVMLNPSLEQVFHQTNAMLCADNDENMFVTLFMGILDPMTGNLEYVSAGHNPPLVSYGGKDFEFLEVAPSLVMGGMNGYAYRSATTVIRPGDMLFLYTDGVTEAMNWNEELFGDSRTVLELDALKGEPVRGVIRGMREAIDRFTQGAPASDDITMLAITLTGPAPDGSDISQGPVE